MNYKSILKYKFYVCTYNKVCAQLQKNTTELKKMQQQNRNQKKRLMVSLVYVNCLIRPKNRKTVHGGNNMVAS